MSDENATGIVTYALGNLLKIQVSGDIRQGEVAFVDVGNGEILKAEVLEIAGKYAKAQSFEDIRGIKLGSVVSFSGELLEIELGPGILSEIFDGLQNPLQKVREASGTYLQRGVHISALDKTKLWKFKPYSDVGRKVSRGDSLGYTFESNFRHEIMVPFKLFGSYTVKWLIDEGDYTIDTVIAKIEDDKGEVYEVSMVQKWPIKRRLICGKVVPATEIITTGTRVIDTMVPIAKGGAACIPGPFGAGKTVMQHNMSKYSDVDIVVVAACGERAGEVVDLIENFPKLMDIHSDRSLMERTVIICNTSAMPVAAREASVYVGVTIGEYYRQMGLDVLVLADSTSRWAQAMREMSGRLEEIPGEEAFPAYLASRLAALYERSGLVLLPDGKSGSVTIFGAVSPAGGNFNEPVTQATLNVVGCFICLSREFSDQRRYPAIDPMQSWSKYLNIAYDVMDSRAPLWSKWVERGLDVIKAGDEVRRRMEVVGQEGTSIQDVVLFLKSELLSFCYLQQNAFDKEDVYCSSDKQISQFELINRIFDIKFYFSDADEAKTYFLRLQSDVKNLNYLAFASPEYKKAFEKIELFLEETERKSLV